MREHCSAACFNQLVSVLHVQFAVASVPEPALEGHVGTYGTHRHPCRVDEDGPLEGTAKLINSRRPPELVYLSCGSPDEWAYTIQVAS